MGGDGAGTFDRVVEFCDGWIPISRRGLPPPDLKERIPILKGKAKAAGRDPDSITVSIWGAPQTIEVVDGLKDVGVDRALFLLPSLPETEAVQALDELTKLMI
jgi:hypothetical protein